MNRLAADFVLILHVAFVAFVLVGQILVVIGLLAGWRWVKNFRFRMLHLLAIGLVVGQSWLGMVCPLTLLEDGLRKQAGEATYGDPGFVAFWLHRLLFYEAAPWVFTLAYSIFGALVLATWIWARPTRRTSPRKG